MKSLFKEAKVDIPESAIDRAHRIGSRYLDASSNNYYKSIIIRFTTFRHRTMFYRAKNKLKRGVRIKLDLTKSRYALLKRVNDYVTQVPSIKFCYADVNCRLKVKFNDETRRTFSSPLSTIFGILWTWRFSETLNFHNSLGYRRSSVS